MNTNIDDLTRELDILEARLDDGERRIAEAKEAGVDTTDWEAFWTGLLASYEDVYRRLTGEMDDREERVLRDLNQ